MRSRDVVLYSEGSGALMIEGGAKGLRSISDTKRGVT